MTDTDLLDFLKAELRKARHDIVVVEKEVRYRKEEVEAVEKVLEEYKQRETYLERCIKALT